MKHLSLLLLVFLLLLTSTGYSQTINKSFEFKTYHNSDRRFKIDYPSFLTIGDRPENNDGRNFTSAGGEIYLVVTSSYFIDQSILELYNEFIMDKAYDITYKVIKANWYVASGFNKNTMKEFYRKVYYSKIEGTQIRSLYLEYPKSKHNDFDLIIPRLVQSFKDI